nr:hypothetical protein [Marinicella sp. W31]MDC2876041.1 hypothetical protein [Marinicella sp. W31]
MVTLDDKGALAFGVSPALLDPAGLPENWKVQPDGAIFEPAPVREALMATLAERLKKKAAVH